MTEVVVHITFQEHDKHGESVTRYGARATLWPGETWEAAAQRVAGGALDQVDEARREDGDT